jgi:hypothetical protein
MTEIVAGWILIPCLLSWSITAASLMRPSGLSGLLFYTYLFCICTVALIAETLGHFHFTQAAYQLVLLPLGSIGAVYWLGFRRNEALEWIKSAINARKGFEPAAQFLAIVWGIIVLYCAVYVVLTAPGHAPDAKIYHLPGPITWVARHSIDAIPHIDFRINYYPHATEILYGFYYFAMGTWQGVELVNVIISGMIWPLCLYLLISTISSDRSWTLLAAIAGSTVTVNLWQICAAYVDVHMTALLTGSIALIIRKKPSIFHIAAAGLAAGIAISIKTTAMLSIAPLAVLVIIQAFRCKQSVTGAGILLFIFFSVVMVSGGAVYLKNWVAFHNPVYPFPLDLKLVSFPGAEFTSRWGVIPRLLRKGTDITDACVKTFSWGFGLLFGWFNFIEEKPSKTGFGFSIEILSYTAAAILGLVSFRLNRTIGGRGTLYFGKFLMNRGPMLIRYILLISLLCIYLRAFWPWGNTASPDQIMNLYNAVIYFLGMLFIVLLSKDLLDESAHVKRVSSDTLIRTGFCIVVVTVFFFLLIKFFAPRGLFVRFALPIVLIPLMLTTLGAQLLTRPSVKYLKTCIVFISLISILNSFVLKDPTNEFKSGLFSPAVKMTERLQRGTLHAYRQSDRKRSSWERWIHSDDILLAITSKGHNIRYHVPGFSRIVYMAHPAGPYRYDADSGCMPFQIRQRLEKDYLSIPKKELRYNYGVGIHYLSYLVRHVGITKIHAAVPIPADLLPENWQLLENTRFGAFYRVDRQSGGFS